MSPGDHDAEFRPRRLVLLDNDPAVLDLLVLDLRLEGHEILASVTDREAAVDACRRMGPDVFVVDLRLGPGPDGLEVAASVADLHLDVVLYTNYVNVEVVDRARGIGATVVEKGSLNALRRAVVGAAEVPRL